MADVDIDSSEIEKRLGYSISMGGEHQYESPKQPARRKSVSGIRRVISPTRSKHQLMRQVSALGMEDPVFQTVEDGPAHPSNIFDDMGVQDIASDCRDMVSVASDHTAEKDKGLDMELFHMSLNQTGPKSRRPSLRDFPESRIESRTLLAQQDSDQTPGMEETDNSESTKQHGSKDSLSLSPMRVVQKVSAVRNSPNRRRSSPRVRKKAPMRHSLTSLDREAVLGASAACSLALEDVFGASKTKGMLTDSSNCDASNTDTLLAEAAEAAKAQGASCSELIEIAKHQHTSSLSLMSAPVHRERRRSHIKPKQRPPTIKEDSKNEMSAPRPRIMPTLSGIFDE